MNQIITATVFSVNNREMSGGLRASVQFGLAFARQVTTRDEGGKINYEKMGDIYQDHPRSNNAVLEESHLFFSGVLSVEEGKMLRPGDEVQLRLLGWWHNVRYEKGEDGYPLLDSNNEPIATVFSNANVELVSLPPKALARAFSASSTSSSSSTNKATSKTGTKSWADRYKTEEPQESQEQEQE